MGVTVHDVVISLWRWAAGLTLGAILGLLLAGAAILMGRRSGCLVHLAGFLRALPILALAPLASLHLGIGELSKISLVAWTCAFPVLISTVLSVSKGELDLELRIGALPMSRGARLRHYVIPRILFGFMSGVEISVGIGWLSVVAAEYMIGSFDSGLFGGGLGRAVFQAFNNDNEGLGVLCLVVLGILGTTTSMGWRKLSRNIVKWFGLDVDVR